MRRAIFGLILTAVLLAAGYFGYLRLTDYLEQREARRWGEFYSQGVAPPCTPSVPFCMALAIEAQITDIDVLGIASLNTGTPFAAILVSEVDSERPMSPMKMFAMAPRLLPRLQELTLYRDLDYEWYNIGNLVFANGRWLLWSEVDCNGVPWNNQEAELICAYYGPEVIGIIDLTRLVHLPGR